MKKTAIILAGAVAFDLGVLVVAGGAAEAPKRPTSTVPSLSLNFVKIDIRHIYLKLDAVNTARDCDHKHGKVVDVEGVPMCQLPNKAAPKPDGR
jgi:hypothetical protein